MKAFDLMESTITEDERKNKNAVNYVMKFKMNEEAKDILNDLQSLLEHMKTAKKLFVDSLSASNEICVEALEWSFSQFRARFDYLLAELKTVLEGADIDA